MAQSSRDDSVKEKRKTRSFTPYNAAERRSKMTVSRGWSPSFWNLLTFWKSENTSREEDEEKHDDDASNGTESYASGVDIATNGANGHADGENNGQNLNGDTLDSSTDDFSEAQVSADLTLQPSRHVHFNLGSQHPDPSTQIKQDSMGNYVAPIPPSSHLRNLSSSQPDPLAQVVDFISGRQGKRISHMEALGLNSLVMQSVYEAERPTAAQHPLRLYSSPFTFASGSTSLSVNPPPPPILPPIPPTFTDPNTDIASLLASVSTSSTSGVLPPSMVNQVSPPTPKASPQRTLARNPNGMLYYLGGGSARPRYRSSAFGASPARKKVEFPRGFGESPRTNGSAGSADAPSPSDGKRRRVGQDAETSTHQASGSAPAMANGSSSETRTLDTPPNASSASLRFGTSLPGARLLATTPARPSPLRQIVRADSSSPSTASPGSINGGSPRAREREEESPLRARASEKASEIMAGIINDATPKKDSVPDVRNPYQLNNRSPTKRTRKPATKALRPPPRPTRSSGTSPQPPPTRSSRTSPPPPPKKLSALETIQRTAPQAQIGSKRSHTGMPPPPPMSSTANGTHAPPSSVKPGSSTKPVVIEIEDVDEEEEEEQSKRPTKKQRTENREGSAEVERTSPTTIDIEDVEMDGSDSSPTDEVLRPSEVVEPDVERQSQSEGKRPIFAGPFSKKAPTARFRSVPKEPSPLRQSFQPDLPPSPPKDGSFTSSAPILPPPPPASSPKSAPSNIATSAFTAPVTSTSPVVAPSPSIFASPSVAPSTDWHAVAKQQALHAPADTLPTFVFAFTGSTVTSNAHMSQRDAALAAPVQDLPKFDFSVISAPKVEIKPFDYQAAGLKPATLSGWICGTCALTSDNGATTCLTCGAPR